MQAKSKCHRSLQFKLRLTWLLLICLLSSSSIAAPFAVRSSNAANGATIVTIRTPEGMHRFKLQPRALSDLLLVDPHTFRTPTIYSSSDQRRLGVRSAASKLNGQLAVIFTGKTTARLYTAIQRCSEPNRAHDRLFCKSSVRRVPQSFHAKCAAHLPDTRLQLTEQSDVQLQTSASRQLSLAIHLDSAFVNKLGENSEAEAISILNAVEAIYLSQLGMRLRISTVERVVAETEPLSSSNAEVLLDQYSKYIMRARTQDRANVHHLFTGKNLFLLDAISTQRLEGIVGLAFIGSTCTSPAESVSLSQLTSAQLGVRTIITAHEIGHNLNATHPEESGLPSESAGIMSAVVKATNTSFSQFSLNEILPFLSNSGQCIAQSSPQIDITQTNLRARTLSVQLSTNGDSSENCQISLYVSSRKRMLNAQIKTNRARLIARSTISSPTSIALSGNLIRRFTRARALYERATIECPSGSGSSAMVTIVEGRPPARP